MNNREFLAALSKDLECTISEASTYSDLITSDIASRLCEGDSVSIYSFGTFDTKKRLERVVVNPATKQRMLVPPKIAVSFKPFNALKDKANGR